MSDNPRPQLYDARYTALCRDACRRARDRERQHRGDALRVRRRPHRRRRAAAAPRRGDLLAVPATGAYTLAMSSNYNASPRPAAVLVRDGDAPRSSGGARPSTTCSRWKPEPMELRFCDDLGPDGFGWIVEEAMTRTSHALAADGRVWLVDAHRLAGRDRACSGARRAGRRHPAPRPPRPRLRRARRATRRPARRRPRRASGEPVRLRARHAVEALARVGPLVGGDTNARHRRRARDEPLLHRGKAPIGVHVLLRLTPPRALGAFEPEQILVGHGEGVHGPAATDALRDALRTSRRGLPGVLLRLPFSGR